MVKEQKKTKKSWKGLLACIFVALTEAPYVSGGPHMFEKSPICLKKWPIGSPYVGLPEAFLPHMLKKAPYVANRVPICGPYVPHMWPIGFDCSSGSSGTYFDQMRLCLSPLDRSETSMTTLSLQKPTPWQVDGDRHRAAWTVCKHKRRKIWVSGFTLVPQAWIIQVWWNAEESSLVRALVDECFYSFSSVFFRPAAIPKSLRTVVNILVDQGWKRWGISTESATLQEKKN